MSRVINFEGRRIVVPDDASDEEVAEILAAPAAEAPSGNRSAGMDDFLSGGGAFADAGASSPAPPARTSIPQQLGRSTQLAAQAVGRAGASIAGMPFDLGGGLIDAGLGATEWGVNRFVDEPVELPRVGQMPMGYDHLRESAGNLMDAIGVPPIEREDMTSQERLIGDVAQFAGEGAALGSGLSRVAAKRFPAGEMRGETPHPGDAFLRPYVGKGVKPVVTDTVSGAGTGVGVNFARENYPDSPTVELLAAIGGGLGGAASADAPGMVRRTAERTAGYRAADLPYGPGGEAPPAQREIQHTRNFLEEQATDIPTARDRAGERFDAARRDGSALPTAGVASDDIGLVALERGSRVRNPVPFEEADQRLLDSAQERISGLRDPGADQTLVPLEVEAERGRRVGPLQGQEAAADAALQSAEQTRRNQGVPLQGVANEQARTSASADLFEAIEGPYVEARGAKNQAFNSIDPQRTTQVDATDVIDAARRIRSDINELAPSGLQMPGEFVRALERIAPDIQSQASPVLDAAGNPIMRDVNVGGDGTAALGDLVEVRKYLSTAQENARQSGNFTLADNLASLRRSVNQTVERTPAAAQANDQYRGFADRYRPSSGDEGAKFTREIDRGRDPAPSRTAGRFLSAPEKTDALRRMAQGADTGPVRNYLRSEFASNVLRDGVLDPKKADAWVRNNADTLAKYPDIQREFAGLAQQAARGEGVSKQARQQLKEAAGNVVNANRDFERSVLGDMTRTDPRNVAKRVLGGNEYGTEGMLREVNDALKSNPAAQRGWKAAVADVLVDKVTNTNTALTRSDDGPVSIAKLQRVWQQHESDLAQIFTPDEMASAKRAHEILEPLGNLSRRSTIGSPTATNQQLTNALEAGLLAYTGNAIATGMIMKRIRVAANMVPGLKEMTLESKTGKLIERMWFDPELFTHIVDTPVKQVEPQGWNAKLNRLIGYNEYMRAEPDEEDDGVMGAITRGTFDGSTGTGTNGPLELTVTKPNNSKELMEAIGGR